MAVFGVGARHQREVFALASGASIPQAPLLLFGLATTQRLGACTLFLLPPLGYTFASSVHPPGLHLDSQRSFRLCSRRRLQVAASLSVSVSGSRAGVNGRKLHRRPNGQRPRPPGRLGVERSEIASRLHNETRRDETTCIPLPIIPLPFRSLVSRAGIIAGVSIAVVTSTIRGNLAKVSAFPMPLLLPPSLGHPWLQSSHPGSRARPTQRTPGAASLPLPSSSRPALGILQPHRAPPGP